MILHFSFFGILFFISSDAPSNEFSLSLNQYIHDYRVMQLFSNQLTPNDAGDLKSWPVTYSIRL